MADLRKKYGTACIILTVWSALAGCAAVSQDAGSPSDALPPGQREVDNFPILRIGDIPDLEKETWTLTATGEVQDTAVFTYDRLLELDTVEVVSDFHCVTGWSRRDNRWTGVLIRTFLDHIRLKPEARFLSFLAADGYSTSLPISECTGDQDMLAFRWEGKRLDKDLGGPVRVVIPGKYGYKSAMWLTEIRATAEKELGYWEKRGYSNTADPGAGDRFSDEPAGGE